MNRQTLKDFLKAKIKEKEGIKFNELIDEIFSILYGSNYKCIKQKRDLGSDGIIETEKICLACYAPEKYDNKKFEKKVDEDFEKYEKHYKNLGYKWQFIINQILLGSMVTYIKTKDLQAEIWGIEELINFILDLPPSKRRRVLLDAFSLPPELIEFDFIEEVIEEILKIKDTEFSNYTLRYELREKTFEKIEKNFTGEDVEIMKAIFKEFYAEHAPYLEKVLNSLGNEFISNLKAKILGKYQIFSEKLSFKEKFYLLLEEFSQKYPKDDEYRNYVQLILLYSFEHCLIGRS